MRINVPILNLAFAVATFVLSAPAIAAVSISVSYRVPAVDLVVLDCISPRNRSDTAGDCVDDGGYRKDWIHRFGPLSGRDVASLAKFTKIRTKHFNDPDSGVDDPLKNRNGFFATRGAETADPMAEAFYSSASLKETYQKLVGILPSAEIDSIKAVLGHFSPRLAVYERESAPLARIAEKVNRSVRDPRYSVFFESIRSFYRVEDDIDFQAVFVWWPPLERTLTPRLGRFILMERNPALPAANDEEGVVFHEIVHEISSRQKLRQKQEITRRFLAGCNPWVSGKVKKLRVLEEPLAVAIGQMLFLDRFMPDTFKSMKRWYRNPWVNEFAPKIFELLKPRFALSQTSGSIASVPPPLKITDGWIESAIVECRKLLAASF